MKVFSYQAFDDTGAKIKGKIEATDQDDAIRRLYEQGLMPFQIDLVNSTDKSELFSSRVTIADLEFFTSELSLLLESGVKIDRAINIIKKNKAKPALYKLLHQISDDLASGLLLSDSFSKHPDLFDKLYINLVQLGEESGLLIETFKNLAKDLKYRRELKRKITQALVYPSVIFFVCILAVYFIFTFIIPQMSEIFTEVELLPWYTTMLIDMSNWMLVNQGMLFFGIIVFFLACYMASKQPDIRNEFQQSLLSIPVVKSAILTAERIRFNSGMALMLSSGISVDKAIELSAGSLKNFRLQRELDGAKQKIKRGGVLSSALAQTSLYPEFYVSLLEVGEESGNLQIVFEEISSRSRSEFEDWTQRLTTLIEPIMILFMGAIVGGVVIVMLLSMVSVNDIGI